MPDNQAPVVTISAAGASYAPVGTRQLVNTQTFHEQVFPSMALLRNGGYVVTWQSVEDVSAQRFDASGAPVGGEVVVNTFLNMWQEHPDVAALSDGGYVVVWQSYPQDPGGSGGGWGVYQQRYDASGTPLGAETRVNTTTASDQYLASVAGLSGGGYVVTWQSTTTGASGVYTQRYDAAGIPQGGETQIGAGGSSPSAAALSGGGYVISWVFTDAPNSTGIFAERFNAAGVPQGVASRVNTATTGDQSSPSVAAMSDGGYVVAWYTRFSSSDSFGVYAQRYDASGTAQGGEILVNTISTDRIAAISVDGLGNGDYAVSWAFNLNTFDIYVRVFDGSGSPLTGEIRVGTQTRSSAPTLAGLADGGFVVGFLNDDGSGAGVYTQRYSPPASLTAIEQTALNLKGAISIADADAGTAHLIVTLGVDHGVLNISVGASGATIVSGNGTGTVVVSGTLAELNALLRTDGTSAITYTPTGDTPPASAMLTVTANDGGATGTDPGLSGGPNDEQGSAQVTISITAVDDPPAAVADAATTPENATVTFAVLGNDTDVDGGLKQVVRINGVAAFVNTPLTLPSGAIATLHADGTITYDPNGKFVLVSAATGAATGASNTSAVDSFTYGINGGSSATISVTVTGVDNPGDQLRGSAGADTITGTPNADYIDVSQGGNDSLAGQGGDDTIVFGAAFNAGDAVDGGGGNDRLELRGNYAGGNAIVNPNIVNVETIVAVANNLPYSITLANANMPATGAMTVSGSDVEPWAQFTFDGSAVTNGSFTVVASLGPDNLKGGLGNDVFYFGPNRHFSSGDFVDGGPGDDQLVLDLRDRRFPVTIDGEHIRNIETIVLPRGQDSELNTAWLAPTDSLVAAGHTLTIQGADLVLPLMFDGSPESNGSFRFYGGHAGDILVGGAGNDWFDAGDGADTLYGNPGDDEFHFAAGLYDPTSDYVYGGSGNDQLVFDGSYTGRLLGDHVTGIETITLLRGPDAAPNSYFLSPSDSLVGAGQTLTIAAADLIRPLMFDGSPESAGSFRFYGGHAGDILVGGEGNDWFLAGEGDDILHGNGGQDTFVYTQVGQSTIAARDAIMDFGDGDKVDLSAIDADATTAGDQAFNWSADGTFHNLVGELRFSSTSSTTGLLEGDINGDGAADFSLAITFAGGHMFGHADIIV